jgi:hypothetical protein
LTKAQWSARREEIKGLLDEHILGTKPARLPLAQSSLLNSSTTSGRVARELYRLEYKVSNSSGSFTLGFNILLLRDARCIIKAPVFMTQSDEWQQPWSLRAVDRGFMAVVYPGGDRFDATHQFYDAFGGNATYSWGLIARRAWLASHVIDFLQAKASTLGADMTNVFISGHSRNGASTIYYCPLPCLLNPVTHF